MPSGNRINTSYYACVWSLSWVGDSGHRALTSSVSGSSSINNNSLQRIQLSSHWMSLHLLSIRNSVLSRWSVNGINYNQWLCCSHFILLRNTPNRIQWSLSTTMGRSPCRMPAEKTCSQTQRSLVSCPWKHRNITLGWQTFKIQWKKRSEWKFCLRQ